MRRCVPLCLVVFAIACKSPEEKACQNTVRINEAAAAEQGRNDGKTTAEHERACLESMVRLREQLDPEEEAWFTYLRCLKAATQMSDQPECLAPLTQSQPASGKQPPN